jgi:hypothetical protein
VVIQRYNAGEGKSADPADAKASKPKGGAKK